MTQSISGFFSGGAKGITWPDNPPASVTGTITDVFKPEEIMDLKDGTPTGKFQIRIILQTDLRDREVDDDDGRRTLYVKSWMRGAIADALRKTGVKEPEVGGQLTVTFTHTEPPERPGLNASKHFKAEYVPATNAAAGEWLNGGSAPVMSTASGSPVVHQQSVPAPEPERPASIDAAAWAAMDASTRQAVANTFAAMPPF